MTVQPDATDEPIEVRRNAGLLALVALGSFAMALAYGWRAVGGDAPAVLWVIVGALVVIGVLHLVAWLDARAPLLVADTHGVRMRVGREWRGLPWVAIDRVELEPRRNLLRDGRIMVVPDSDEEPLSLPMGLATAARADEVVRRLTGLAKDRTAVSVRVSHPAEQAGEPEAPPDPEPEWETSAAEYAATRDAIDDTDGPTDGGFDPQVNPAGPVNSPGPAGPPTTVGSDRPRSPTTIPAIQGAGRAVRAEVTRSGPSSIGMLALQPDPADLPEARELRGTEGRVGLVIEATPAVEEPETAAVDSPAARTAETPSDDATADGEPDVADDAVEAVPVIGQELREARERLHLSVDDLAERTRIRPHVIESIEADDFSPCGGDFYARGHLRSLSRVLGVESDDLIAAYDDTYAHAPIEARKVFEAELATGPRPSIRLTTGGPNWAALIAVVLVLGIIWGAVQYFSGSDEADGSSGTVTAPSPDASDANNAIPELGPPTRNRLVLTGRGPNTKVVVRSSDGTVAWRGSIAKGKSKRLEVPGKATVEVVRGAGVRTKVNGNRSGALDARGPNSKATLGKK